MTVLADPRLRRLVEAATRAPSSHNTQPWRLRCPAPDRIELDADRTRALPVNDPHDRELTISCGAALLNLQAAAALEGCVARTEWLPEGADRGPLARVELVAASEVDPDLARLAGAVGTRRTTRQPFERRALPGGLGRECAELAARFGARLAVVDDDDRRRRIAELVGEGDRAQFADPRWRRELAAWLRPRRRGDGLATPWFAAPFARLVVRHFDLGAGTARADVQRVLDAPLLAVLTTARDDPEAWLVAGGALEAVLLHAAGCGVQAAYMNQPCQVAALRPRLREVVGVEGFPQVVLLLGHARAAPPSPRRPASDVLEDASPSSRVAAPSRGRRVRPRRPASG